MKVLNFGSLNLDYVYQVDHAAAPGETVASKGMSVFGGGKGLNQSIALAKAGVFVYHAGLIGEGGEMLLSLCHENGIDTRYVRKIEGKNGHAVIQVDQSGQNCILLYGGSNQKVSASFAEEVLSDFLEGDLILLQNEISSLSAIIDLAYERKMTIVLNPSPYNEAIRECDLGKVSIFLINEVEGRQITGKESPKEILSVMRSRYPDAKVVLTLGEKGVAYGEGNDMIMEPAKKVKAVDTTAAGDTFTGYFISGILSGLPIRENLKRAVKASAIAVSRKGAAASIPLLEEVWQE